METGDVKRGASQLQQILEMSTESAGLIKKKCADLDTFDYRTYVPKMRDFLKELEAQ